MSDSSHRNDPSALYTNGRGMNAPDGTLTNGHFELPASAHGVLVLADPPETGRRMRTHSNKEASAEFED